jgi:bacterioferritin-associated ferredoxin
MIVCICRRISDRDIRREAHSGCANFEELQLELGVATCCGCCEETALEVFDRAREATGTSSAPAGVPGLALA